MIQKVIAGVLLLQKKEKYKMEIIKCQCVGTEVCVKNENYKLIVPALSNRKKIDVYIFRKDSQEFRMYENTRCPVFIETIEGSFDICGYGFTLPHERRKPYKTLKTVKGKFDVYCDGKTIVLVKYTKH